MVPTTFFFLLGSVLIIGTKSIDIVLPTVPNILPSIPPVSDEFPLIPPFPIVFPPVPNSDSTENNDASKETDLSDITTTTVKEYTETTTTEKNQFETTTQNPIENENVSFSSGTTESTPSPPHNETTTDQGETPSSPHHETTTYQVETSSLPNEETTTDNGQINSVVDFEKLVYEYIHSQEKLHGFNMSWFNFYDGRFYIPVISLYNLKPLMETDIKISLSTDFQIVYSRKGEYEDKFGRNILHNANDFDCYYILENPFRIIDGRHTLSGKSFKLSSWFAYSNEYDHNNINILRESPSKSFQRLVGFSVDLPLNSYTILMRPNETMQIDYTGIKEVGKIGYSLTVFLRGNIVIALDNGEGDLTFKIIPLANLANDEFQAWENGLKYEIRGDFDYEYIKFPNGNYQRLPHPVPIEFSYGKLTIKKREDMEFQLE